MISRYLSLGALFALTLSCALAQTPTPAPSPVPPPTEALPGAVPDLPAGSVGQAPEGEAPAADVDPSTPRRFDFEGASLSRVFRLLAKQAGIDYIEPPIDPSETISFELSNVTPLQAFRILAERRGFRIVVNNGIYELVRDDVRNPNRDTVYLTRTYALRNTDARLVFEGVANLLNLEIRAPEGVTKGYPKPQEISATSSLSSGSDTGGGGGDEGGQSQGKFTSGFPMASAYAQRDTQIGEKEFAFTDRRNVIVVRTTQENHQQLAEYLRRIDHMDNSIVVEVKVLSVSADKSKDIGSEWNLFFGRDRAGNPLFSIGLGGNVTGNPPNNRGSNTVVGGSGVGGSGFPQNTTIFGDIASGIVGGFSYSTFGYFLRDFQVNGRISLLKQNGRLYDINQPVVITKSGVPVTISSLTEEPIQNFTNTGGTVSEGDTVNNNLSTDIQTFKYGILLDVLATELQNGNVDLTVTPRISTRIGEKDNGQGQTLPIIQANTTTTTVTVPPGRTVALGGILTLNEQKQLRETPGLSKIPYIGKFLFSREARSLVRTNVIILVTPRIIRSGYSPTITAGCDEQYGLELGERLGSTIVPSKSAKGYLPTDSSSYDPSDPFEKECLERPGEKQVLKRSAHSKE